MKRIFDVEEVDSLTCISSLNLLNLRHHVAAAAAACAAFKLPKTANAMTGETEYEICIRKSAYHVFAAATDRSVLTINNFAIPNFSSSPAPFTSASAVNFKAGGPVGINIRQNHNSGSSKTQEVRVASRYMSGMLMAGQRTKRVRRMTRVGVQGREVSWESSELVFGDFIFCAATESLTPTTMIWRTAKREPRFEKVWVIVGLRWPPNCWEF